jgi:group I intron endonuclease
MGQQKVTGIYRIVHLASRKYYVGSSINIEGVGCGRRYHHFYMLRRGIHHCDHLQHAWSLYGEEAFRFEILELCEEGDLISREQFYMDRDGPLGLLYNATLIAGRIEMTEATKEKIGIASKRWLSSNPHPRLGAVVTPETRAKMSISCRGKKRSAEFREKCRTRMLNLGDAHPWRHRDISGDKNPNFGKKHSLETRRLMSQNRGSIAGSNNPRFDKTIYHFRNDSGEDFIGTRFDFYTKFRLSKSKVCQLLSGKAKSCKGWVLIHRELP